MISVEAEKKRGHRPIRRLLGDAGGAIQALKPCFMMSPLSVSQYLPTSLNFDVVIFDEASQVRPCDAINAVYRGNRLIVAGDDKQLPPTSFFGMGTGDDSDDWSDDQPEVFESVLGLCRGAGQLPSLPLRWHYRSRHESLITYSNRQFYESRLVTFPGAIASGPDVGVQHFHVNDGIYGRGHSKDNVVEARAVVARILEHAENRPHLSAGVVAFSEPQATRIAMELEAARRNRPDLDSFFTADRLDGFFVKNLENVQGDERDVIIFSVGYGRDEHGKFTMNFGPLNREGGFRRLNVAVTRARHRIELVSSIVAADITDQTNYGVQCLKSYLDYAVRGISALAPAPDTPDPGAAAESPFEEEVLETVRRWGFEVQPQVGHLGYRIDMGIADPRRPGAPEPGRLESNVTERRITPASLHEIGTAYAKRYSRDWGGGCIESGAQPGIATAPAKRPASAKQSSRHSETHPRHLPRSPAASQNPSKSVWKKSTSRHPPAGRCPTHRSCRNAPTTPTLETRAATVT